MTILEELNKEIIRNERQLGFSRNIPSHTQRAHTMRQDIENARKAILANDLVKMTELYNKLYLNG